MKGVWKSGFFKIGLACAVVVILILAVALPAMAATPTPATSAANIKYTIINGKVSAIATDSKSFTVQPETGNAVVIQVDGNTKYYKTSGTLEALDQVKADVEKRQKDQQKVKPNPNSAKPTVLPNERGQGTKTQPVTSAVRPGIDVGKAEQMPEMKTALDLNAQESSKFWGKLTSMFNRNPVIGKSASFADLAVGDGVVVKVMPNETLAIQVMIIKPSLIKSARGTITAVANGTFTLTTTANPAQTIVLKWDANTHVSIKGAIAIAAAQTATVVYNTGTMIASSVDAQIPVPTPTITATPTTTSH